MSQQTTYGFQSRGFAGQRVGIGHNSRSYVNDAGSVKQVDDLTFAVVNTHLYSVTVNGIVVSFTSDSTATAAEIRDGMLAAFRAIQALETVATANPNGNGVRITARTPGTGFTVANADGSTTITHTTANSTTQPITFGRAVAKRTGTGTVDASAGLPVTEVAQLDTITWTAAGHADGTYTVTINGNPISFTAATSSLTAIITALANEINLQPLGVVAANVAGTSLTITAAVAGTPFTTAIASTGGATTMILTHTTANTGNMFLGIAERVHSDVDPVSAGETITPFSDMTVGHQGTWLAEVEVAVAFGDPVFYRTAASGANTGLGMWRNDSDSGNARLVPQAFFRSSTTGAGIASLELNLP